MVVIITLVFAGCKRKGCTDPSALNYDMDAQKNCCCNYTEVFDLGIDFDFRVSIDPFLYNTPFTDQTGRKFDYSFVRMYLSNFRLVNASGETHVNDTFLLIDPTITKYNIGKVAVGDYSKIRFDIGIDSITNSTKQPADFAQDHPLGPQSPSMYWAWNTGYIFLKLEGSVDTNLIPDGTIDWPYVFHLGTNQLLRSVELNYPVSGDDGQKLVLDIGVDLARFFDFVDLRTENSSHTLNNLFLAKKVVDNGPNVFYKK